MAHRCSLPVYDIQNNKIIDGIIIKASDTCLLQNKKQCKLHYESICNKEGQYMCPYGYTTKVVTDGEGKNIVFSGFRLEGLYKGVKDVDTRYNPRLSQCQVDEIVNDYLQTLEDKRKQIEADKFIKDITHEIRNFNTQIQSKSELLSNRLIGLPSKKQDIQCQEWAKGIFQLSYLVAERFLTYDATVNPKVLLRGTKISVGVFKKFDKIRKCYLDRAKEKNVTIRLKGNSSGKISAYTHFDLIPFLILENAIKYAPENTECTITFKERAEHLSICVESIGPRLEEGEITKITQKGFRGKSARVNCDEGNGIGLYLTKQLCDIHNVSINFEMNPINEQVGTFIIRLAMGIQL